MGKSGGNGGGGDQSRRYGNGSVKRKGSARKRIGVRGRVRAGVRVR